VWNDERCKKFRETLGKIEIGEEEMELIWERMEGKVKKVLQETEKGRENERGKGRGWWDKECEEKKKGVRKELRKWRRRGGEGREYRRRKQEYKELCERKKRRRMIDGRGEQ